MAKEIRLILDNWSKGLLISIISKAISDDRDMTQDDIEKLKKLRRSCRRSRHLIEKAPLKINCYKPPLTLIDYIKIESERS